MTDRHKENHQFLYRLYHIELISVSKVTSLQGYNNTRQVIRLKICKQDSNFQVFEFLRGKIKYARYLLKKRRSA